MITLIENALKEARIPEWFIKKTVTKRAELYFVKNKLDMPRYADISEYQVTVYRIFEEAGRKFRGATVIYVEPGQEEEEILQKVKDAYFGAQFVKNPYYELPEGLQEEKKNSPSDLRGKNLQEVVNAFAEGIFAVPSDQDAFVNSAEIYFYQSTVELFGSNGLKVSYDTDKVDGECVTQCLKPKDVEQFRKFALDQFDVNALKEQFARAIEDVRKRAQAESMPKSGTYSVIIQGDNLVEFFDYYLSRSSSSVVFPGYSDWKKGEMVQKSVTKGEELNLNLVATVPYSDDGIPMKNRPLLEKGVLKSYHGATRFLRYLQEEPTGTYQKFEVKNGTVPLSLMKQEGTLETVSFSDFQMDFFTGHFGGEIRLALLKQDGKELPLAGGSINGSLKEVEDQLIFSKERYETDTYSGPYAVLIPNVPVAGA